MAGSAGGGGASGILSECGAGGMGAELADGDDSCGDVGGIGG